jgi:DmsE family decaheme c-type cytochrome
MRAAHDAKSRIVRSNKKGERRVIQFFARLAASTALIVLCCGTSATALAQPSTVPPDGSLKGDAICTKCHDETEKKAVLSIYKTRHGVRADSRTPGCQTCHGASEAHVKNPDKTQIRPWVDIQFGGEKPSSVGVQVAACLTCHKTGQRAHWAGSEHERRDIACTTCHAVHVHEDRVMDRRGQVEVCTACHKAQQAQIHRVSTHPILAGKMGCSECHNPHGSVSKKLMNKNSINETCYTCHAERRGPFLWEHSPVMEDCTICHNPHGSNNATLLVRRTPWLCQECHTADHSRDVNSGANLPNGNLTTINGRQPLANQNPRAQMNARNCVQCHSMVHGSNHPAGARFNR